MPELVDMKPKEKFSFPGVFDMSKKDSPVVVLQPIEDESEPLAPVAKKPVAVKKTAPVGERKTLKLGKKKA
jgi:hypothetical protein